MLLHKKACIYTESCISSFLLKCLFGFVAISVSLFQDYRGLQSKVCSTSSLNSESSSISRSFRSAIDINDDANESSALLSREADSIPFSPPTMPLLQDTAISNPISIKGKRFGREMLLSNSAPASGSSSPLPGYRNSPRQQFYRVRKSSSSNSFTLFAGKSSKYKSKIQYLPSSLIFLVLPNTCIPNYASYWSPGEECT